MFLACRARSLSSSRRRVLESMDPRRVLSSSALAAFDLPTRHSLMQPPKVCTDPIELREETARLMEAPVGTLYAGQATVDGGREEAYELAYHTIQKAEYLQFGHASQIPGTMYASSLSLGGVEPLQADMNPLALMKTLVERLEQEGEMYLQLRRQKQRTTLSHHHAGKMVYMASPTVGDDNDDESDSSSDDETTGNASSSSSSSDDDDDSEDETEMSAGTSTTPSFEFAPPGPTAKMQEALLDAMACVGTAAPGDYFEIAIKILEANDLDKGTNPYTLPSHVTYNAALRGISRCPLAEDDAAVRDEAISSAFALYNHLTHSLHLPRNSATFVYMLQTVNNVFPASRVKGNICVTLWDHASRLGVADTNVIETLKEVLGGENGPEFEILTDELSGAMPQKYRKFVNKYRHSDNY